MYNKATFADWVPKPLMLFIMAVILLPTLSISGVYTSNATDIAGSMAVYSEYIALANNASSIGMGLSILIVMRIKMRFRTKELITGSAIILSFLSFVCGTTESPYVLVAASFLIGFFKIFIMIELIMPIMFMIAPNGERGKFYALFYPFSICLGQLSAYFYATLIFNGNYQAPYQLMSILMLLVAALSIIFQHNERFSFKVPLYQIDWLSLVLLIIPSMSFNIFFTFMKQQAWFSSPLIIASVIIGIIFLGLTIWRQKFLRRKMFNFKIFYKKTNVLHGLVLLFLLGLYLSATTVYLQYTVGVLGYNNLVNAEINLWMIPGVVCAGIYAFFSFKYNWNIKYYIASGFVGLFIHTLLLYLLIQPQMTIEYLQYTMIFKGFGMGSLFIGIWFYANSNLPPDDMFGTMSILLIIRGFLGTAFGGAVIGYALYQGQWQSLNDLAVNLDNGNFEDGMSIYKNISLNSLMASGKIVLGGLCWFIVPVLLFVLTHHYGKFNYRRIVIFRKVISGSTIRGYKIS
ncbi:MFS transporter [Chryseobacterium terrae]|uniref:Major facilitator superfamily (MFS) profile domain-containing protein n=1 Tax=Chryseobacterium terrae TaxID=3163299 RepID=A0ABW8Y166_9FLAO